MDTDGKQRAARAYRSLMQGKDAAEIAEAAGIPDPATVRSFLEGMSWPRRETRKKLEDAAGLEWGDLTLYAHGDKVVGDEDLVIQAIEKSQLKPGSKLRLQGIYVDMMEAQGEEVKRA